MKNPALALLGLALTTVPQAFSQCAVDPLNGSHWVFNVQATEHAPERVPIRIGLGFQDHDFAIAGHALARNGILEIVATSIVRRSPTRLERDIGSYQLNANCTGGTITMNLSSYPMQYDFWFFDNNRSLYLVSILNGKPAVGSATRAPAACPVGLSSPLALLSGDYTFRAQGLFEDPYAYGIAGVFSASGGTVGAASWLQIGGLDIVATSNLTRAGSVTRLERDHGTYSVDSSCWYGTLTFNLSSRPVQFDFFFRDGFQSGDMISTSPGRRIFGTFNR